MVPQVGVCISSLQCTMSRCGSSGHHSHCFVLSTWVATVTAKMFYPFVQGGKGRPVEFAARMNTSSNWPSCFNSVYVHRVRKILIYTLHGQSYASNVEMQISPSLVGICMVLSILLMR